MIQPVPSPENMIIIIAGNYRQAQHFAKAHGIYPKYWNFLNEPKQARGLQGSVVYTGTYYQRKDLAEIEQEVNANPALKVLDIDE